MTLETEYDGNGIDIIIDYVTGEMTIEKSNNGGEGEVYMLEIGDFVNIKTTGAQQNFHFSVISNGNSGNSVKEDEKETINDDVSVETEPEIINNGTSTEVESEVVSDDVPMEVGAKIVDDNVPIEIKPEIVNDDVSVETESETIGDGTSTKAESEIIQNNDPADNQTSDDSIEAIETDPNSESDQPSVEEIREKDLDFVFLTKNGIRILAVLLGKMELKRDEINVTDVPSSNVSNALKELEESNLICYENNRRLIKPNLEKVSISCLWLYDSQIQKIVNSEFDFRFGRSVQNILHLLYNYPDGLYRDAITIGTSLSKPVFNKAIVTMERYGLIEVTGKRNETIIFPKFSANHVEKDSIISQKPIVVETDLANTEESVADSDAGREDLLISQRPTAVETVLDQEMTVAVNTAEGFNIEKLESFIGMILKGFSVVKVQTLSSQFKIRLKDGGITKLLDVINERIKIEVVNIKTREVMTSWKPKRSKNADVYFEGIAFGNLEVRKKTDNLKEEDPEEEETVLVSGVDSTESVNDDIIREEQKKEDTVKKIREMIAEPNLGDSQKIVLTILLDNYLSNDSLKIGRDDLIDKASKRNLGKEQVKVCFGGLLALKHIKKPNEIIELNIEM